jgi:tRNA A-37 threonylcarbamoyl transferase component Bud32
VQQIIDAVAFIHSVKVIYGDLTRSNVSLTKEMDGQLGGFGRSTSSHHGKVVAHSVILFEWQVPDVCFAFLAAGVGEGTEGVKDSVPST